MRKKAQSLKLKAKKRKNLIHHWSLVIGHSLQSRAGFTLMEIIVVIMLFAFLGILTARSLGLSLKGTRKSEAIAHVQENLNYAMNIMERHIRGAKSLDCGSSSGSRLFYVDAYGNDASFQCATVGTDTFIASNSASRADRITSESVVVDCNNIFSCNEGTGVPDSVDINISAYALGTVDAEGFQVTSSSKIQLRSY